MPLPVYYTTSDLVESLGVSTRTINRWTDPEKTCFSEPFPRPVRMVTGTQNRYEASKVDEWIKNIYEKSHLSA